MWWSVTARTADCKCSPLQRSSSRWPPASPPNLSVSSGDFPTLLDLFTSCAGKTAVIEASLWSSPAFPPKMPRRLPSLNSESWLPDGKCPNQRKTLLAEKWFIQCLISLDSEVQTQRLNNNTLPSSSFCQIRCTCPRLHSELFCVGKTSSLPFYIHIIQYMPIMLTKMCFCVLYQSNEVENPSSLFYEVLTLISYVAWLRPWNRWIYKAC